MYLQIPVTAEIVTKYSSVLVAITNDSSGVTADGLTDLATSLQSIVEVADPSKKVSSPKLSRANFL